jgi:S1-C subfamily serine protease
MRFLTFIFICFWAMSAQAEQRIYGFSGTGFFVSQNGHIITNHHVIKQCKDISIRGAVTRQKATLIASDGHYDLALLRADVTPDHIAPISSNSPQDGEKVMIMGYPLDRAVKGDYKIEEARILAPDQTRVPPGLIPFTDVAQQGNSGGPLLDSSGNVAGVVVGKVNLGDDYYSPLKNASIAINLPTLKDFLNRQRVSFTERPSSGYFRPSTIESDARKYIVNIFCFIQQ